MIEIPKSFIKLPYQDAFTERFNSTRAHRHQNFQITELSLELKSSKELTLETEY